MKRKKASGKVPGIEWGGEEMWRKHFDLLLEMDPAPERAIEIGQGAGKYTKMMLDRYPDLDICCQDVSWAFLEAAKEELASDIGRLQFRLIRGHKKSFLENAQAAFKNHPVDIIYSMDAMVHVDQQMTFNYIELASLLTHLAPPEPPD